MPVLMSNGTELYFELRGPADAPVVVFSNSLGCSLEMWAPQVAELTGRYRVLTYDTRGHGRSKVTPGDVGANTLAEDLAGLMDALHIKSAHIVGLSLGGRTAQILATIRPDLVLSLVLMATAAHFEPAQLFRDRAALVREKGMSEIVAGVMERWFSPHFRNDAAAIGVRDRLLAMAPEGYAVASLSIVAEDIRPRLGSIRVPTLVISGSDDPATPPAKGEELRSLIPGAELVVLSDTRHILNLEASSRVTRHLKAFLDDVAQRPPAPHAVGVEAGLANRRMVLGAEHVERSLSKAGRWGEPWQAFIADTAWAKSWGDPRLPWKTRSLLVLVMMTALHREEEFKLHLRPALKNGLTLAEIQSALVQAAVYSGVPASNAAFRWVREVLGDEADMIA